MALQSCKECGKEISTEAEKCPHCGKLVRRGGTQLLLLILGGLLVLAGPHVVSVFLHHRTPVKDLHTSPGTVSSSVSSSPSQPQSVKKHVTAKDVLAEAQEDLKSGQPEKVADLGRDAISGGSDLLDDPQYPKYEGEILRVFDQADLRLRNQMASQLQKQMFDHGEEVYANVVGSKKDTLEVSGGCPDRS